MKFICNKINCKFRDICGGAKPHEFDPNECNNCQMKKDAKCIEIEDILIDNSHEIK